MLRKKTYISQLEKFMPVTENTRVISIVRLAAFLSFVFLIACVPVYADHVHHLWYNNAQWQDEDLTALTQGGLPPYYAGIAAFFTKGNDQLHVYYVDASSQHINQLYFNGQSWSNQDLTAITGGQTAYAGGMTGFAIENLQYVFYTGTDNDVHMLSYNNTYWSDQDITRTVGGLWASTDLVAFPTTPNDQFHIYFKGWADNSLYQLYFDGSSWSEQSLTSITGTRCDSRLTGFAIGNTQHVFCAGPGGAGDHFFHTYYNNASWVVEDITAAANGQYGDLNASLASFAKGDKLEFYGVSVDGSVHQYTFKKKWTDLNLSATKGAPYYAGFGGIVSFHTTNRFHLYYQSLNSQNHGEVYQVYFNGSNWQSEDLTGGAGQAEWYNGGMAGFNIGNLQHIFYLTSQ